MPAPAAPAVSATETAVSLKDQAQSGEDIVELDDAQTEQRFGEPGPREAKSDQPAPTLTREQVAKAIRQLDREGMQARPTLADVLEQKARAEAEKAAAEPTETAQAVATETETAATSAVDPNADPDAELHALLDGEDKEVPVRKSRLKKLLAAKAEASELHEMRERHDKIMEALLAREAAPRSQPDAEAAEGDGGVQQTTDAEKAVKDAQEAYSKATEKYNKAVDDLAERDVRMAAAKEQSDAILALTMAVAERTTIKKNEDRDREMTETTRQGEATRYDGAVKESGVKHQEARKNLAIVDAARFPDLKNKQSPLYKEAEAVWRGWQDAMDRTILATDSPRLAVEIAARRLGMEIPPVPVTQPAASAAAPVKKPDPKPNLTAAKTSDAVRFSSAVQGATPGGKGAVTMADALKAIQTMKPAERAALLDSIDPFKTR